MMYSATAGFLPESMILVNFGAFFLVFEKRNLQNYFQNCRNLYNIIDVGYGPPTGHCELLSQDIPTTNAFQRNFL